MWDFAAKARELCDEFGALLIFDEVVTAFRVGPGGAQGFFNVRPDLTVFGKIVAGGYPMAGGVGGSEERGLSELGRCAIAKMEELGMILDVSHLNERSFWDVVACARKPFIASHSNAYALCAHRRNLKDEQLKAIAKAGGIIGINSANQFIDEKRSKQDCAHLVKHMKYIADLSGIEHVALGLDCMDFFEDDNEMPLDFLSCEDTGRLLEEMKKVFTLTEIKQIAGENAKALFRTKKG